MTRSTACGALFAAAIALAGCATTRAPDPRDPLEPANRATYQFNDALDRAVFKPVAEGYRAVLPGVVQTGVRNFFANLSDPWIALNQLLQGKVDDGLSDVWRFIANSTFGIVGLVDVASDMQMPKHNEDFGQTLAVWGLGFGPYLVLPIVGPSSVRDGVGVATGFYANPAWSAASNLDIPHQVAWTNSLIALNFVQTRADLLDATNALQDAALDPYAFVRNAYFQRRRSLIYDGNPPPRDEDRDREAEPASASASGPMPPRGPMAFRMQSAARASGERRHRGTSSGLNAQLARPSGPGGRGDR